MLEYLLGDLDASLVDVAGAADSTDPFIRNLAGVVAGLAWDAKGQPDRALAAYRAAVEAMPQSTAAVAFATHSGRAGVAIIRPQIATQMYVQPLLRVLVPATPAVAGASPSTPRPVGVPEKSEPSA